MSFDESDAEFMDALGASMATLVPLVFPAELHPGHTLSLKYDAQARLEAPTKQRFVEIIDRCMGPLYRQNKGELWKTEKMEEMDTAGLVFVWYEHEKKPVAFVSLKMCEEPHGKTLYLYEIHVLPEMQKRTVGQQLLLRFHAFSRQLDALCTVPDLQHFSNTYTELTVFADNVQAVEWYHRHGYELAPDSPTDRTMRGGVKKPEYYLLYKRHV